MIRLARLLQLASPALPVGAYTYSQGLEWAVECGTVHNEASAARWIGDLLEWNLGRFEAPLLLRLLATWQDADTAALGELNDAYLASRETSELRAETLQMGHSLAKLLPEFKDIPAATLQHLGEFPSPTFPLVWSCAAAAWRIAPPDALTAWAWSWAENQVMAALKAVPLGQSAGQRLLLDLGGRLPGVVERALLFEDDDFSNIAPAFAIASCCHETQYSRLFRS